MCRAHAVALMALPAGAAGAPTRERSEPLEPRKLRLSEVSLDVQPVCMSSRLASSQVGEWRPELLQPNRVFTDYQHTI